MTDEHVKINHNQITENLYIGTNQCCRQHFEKDLISEGVEADISLEGEKLDHPWGIKYFLWLPTADKTAPTMHALALGTQKIAYCDANNIKVYIHCKNGHGRAPTLVAAYFISQGLKVKDAVEKIRKKRREIHLEPVQKATLELFAKNYKW